MFEIPHFSIASFGISKLALQFFLSKKNIIFKKILLSPHQTKYNHSIMNVKMNFFDTYNQQINELCRLYNVSRLLAFGSVLTDGFNEQSDVDLIVTFSDIPVEKYADNYFDFKFSLQDVFNRPVDLLEEQAIKNPYFLQNVDSNKQIIYGY